VLLYRDAEGIEPEAFGPLVFAHRLTTQQGNGLLAVRPDGYVGFCCGTANVSQLNGWLARVGASRSLRRNQEPDAQANLHRHLVLQVIAQSKSVR
jgi:hypothetical protein